MYFLFTFISPSIELFVQFTNALMVLSKIADHSPNTVLPSLCVFMNLPVCVCVCDYMSHGCVYIHASIILLFAFTYSISCSCHPPTLPSSHPESDQISTEYHKNHCFIK